MEPSEFESFIVRLLFIDKDARETLIPFLDASLFDDFENKEIVKNCLDFLDEWKKFPNVSELKILLKQKDVYEYLVKLMNKEIDVDDAFIKHEIEKYIRDKLLWNEIIKTTEGLKQDNDELKNSSADRINNALAFSFDSSVGTDVVEDGERIYNSLHNLDKVVSTGLKEVDEQIKGGLHEKTLTLFMGETNIGKTLVKCALASNCLLNNKNVLYVTLEMSEDKISERILANIFDVNINDLDTIPKERFMHKFQEIKKVLKGRLIVKEYPTNSINTNRIRALLKELQVKRNFVPDVVFVDMVDVMLPNRMNKSSNTNTELKTICQELRGLAMETGLPFVSSRQINRDGYGDSQIELTNVAESIGTTTVADIIYGMTQTEELREAGKYCFILLKNRYGLNKKKCLVNVNYSRMRLSNDQQEDETKSDVIHKEDRINDAASHVTDTIKNNRRTEKKKIINIDMGQG
jgi:replicative DNA helicase